VTYGFSDIIQNGDYVMEKLVLGCLLGDQCWAVDGHRLLFCSAMYIFTDQRAPSRKLLGGRPSLLIEEILNPFKCLQYSSGSFAVEPLPTSSLSSRAKLMTDNSFQETSRAHI